MALDYQVTYESGIPYFTAFVQYVDAENPEDGTIRMGGPYYIEAWTCVDAGADPPVLIEQQGPTVEGRNGSGGYFKIPCASSGDFIIFAYRRLTYEGDPWERQTSGCMGGSRNMQGGSFVRGYLQFNLLPSG
jgi:hypothetical protein